MLPSLKTPFLAIGKIICALSATLLIGCLGMGTQPAKLPAVSIKQATIAAAEIANFPVPTPRQLSIDQANTEATALSKRLLPAATEVCQYIEENENCSWRVILSEDELFNADADLSESGEHIIVIHIGLTQHTHNEDELAALIAHEIGHRIANHIAEKKQNETSAYLGKSVAHSNYTRDQELESDYLAAYILHRSGFDLDRARNLRITHAQALGDNKVLSTWGQTHPSFPERLAAWDITIDEIDNGLFPRRKKGYTRRVTTWNN